MMKAVIGILDESDHPKLCSWLKSLKHQPKQEWSEEDVAICGFIYDLLACITWKEDWCVDEVTCLNWVGTRLKFLKPPEQKYTLADLEAEWKHGYDFAIGEMGKSMPMPEDTVLFNKGVAEGRRLEREEMPKWRKIDSQYQYPASITREMDVNGDYQYCISTGNIYDGCEYISLAELEKLPREE